MSQSAPDPVKSKELHQALPADFCLDHVLIRLARDDDHSFLCELFQESVIEGLVGDNDTGADIDNLREGYFEDGGQSGFWVACLTELVIGMIGVQKVGENAAEVRRLRVRGLYRRRGVGTLLMERALSFCRHQGYLKVVLDVRIERGPAIALFHKFGFKHARTREIGGRKLLDFYIDLYRDLPA
ncbi:MAG: GNAT family N-acetyltransferase [Phycisphaerales bacterium]|nr:GNAT family N-acetyltransferase [Phycisphaerales bacterium]MCI0631763.1 GNAT family N-acetyltransferase [Phycisphaerales bacterium]MCI0677384.1 GNAT family N-acetyltransferase [Phycisphaerales bacterium]